ncbi:fec operon regulator FecR [Delftia tsuruhatensis]|uniref:FecR domain-containing protein n=1 Tax=Delftia tsuruhatensis TaxID=180282 RepID=UPI001E6B4920|nr:FecR domain-containing protein [Delftia tsuruhatensis]CAB5716212.1 fec operon regulator FecR [Delftia tsuruhatensis]CAC9686103.1 fec operon regulator FecR [Delftia tsuruhatensis]
MSPQPCDAAAPLPREVALQAAEWFVLLHSGEAGEADLHDFEAWRTQAAVHDQAWQRALAVSQRAAGLPPALGGPALGRKQRRMGRRESVRALALLITAAPVGWLAWRVAPWTQWTSTHATATGERREWTLADGSHLVLDTASAVDVRLDGQRRMLFLRSGAVLVRTAPDPLGRSLVVVTAQGRVRALGTRFTVRQEDGRSHVAVFEGAVEIVLHEDLGMRQVPAGAGLSFSDTRIEPATAVDAGAGQWARGLLAVQDMRLADFLAELSRYRQGWLICDPAVAGLRVTGAFQLVDTDAVLGNLVHLLPVQVRYRTRYWVTVAPPGG